MQPRRVFLKMGEFRAHPGLVGGSGSTGATAGAKPLGERAGDPVSRGGLALGTAVRPPSTRGSVRVGVDVRTSSRLWEVQRGEVSAAQGPGKEASRRLSIPRRRRLGGHLHDSALVLGFGCWCAWADEPRVIGNAGQEPRVTDSRTWQPPHQGRERVAKAWGVEAPQGSSW